MTEFAENLKLLVGTMGYKFMYRKNKFFPSAKDRLKGIMFFHKFTQSKVPKQKKYSISASRGAKATSVLTSEGIVVIKGFSVATSEVPSTPDAISKPTAL